MHGQQHSHVRAPRRRKANQHLDDQRPYHRRDGHEVRRPFRRELLNHIRMEFDRMYFVVMHEAFRAEPVVEEVADV